jgi:hypothetical protein
MVSPTLQVIGAATIVVPPATDGTEVCIECIAHGTVIVVRSLTPEEITRAYMRLVREDKESQRARPEQADTGHSDEAKDTI